jgi:long-chain acyl-CoA synthetase
MENRIWHNQYDPGVPTDIDIPDIPFFQFLTRAAQETPNRICIQFNNTEITYAQAEEITNRIAKNIAAFGLKKGDCVGICMPNIPQFVLLYFAALKAGCVVAAINPRYGMGEIRTLIQDVKPQLVFAGCEPAQAIRRIKTTNTLIRMVLTTPEDAPSLWGASQEKTMFNPSVGYLLDFIAMETNAQLPVVTPQDDCIYQYSGGTTGTPKAAAAVHRNLVANTLQFRSWLSTLESGQEITLTAIPLYHVYGMVIAMCVTLSLNSTILLHDERKGIPGLLKLIDQQKPTLFPAVPHLLEILAQQDAVISGEIDLSSLKIIIAGASPLRKECQKTYDALLPNGRLVQGYGLSEAPTATHCNPVQGDNRIGTIGLPLPGVDVKVVDVKDPNIVLPQGEIGEMWLRSPQVMRGYHNRIEETRNVLKDGWLATGDIVQMDKDGYFTIVDRKKDLMKVSGFQVWPRELEIVLSHHPDIYEAGVISMPEPIIGEKIIAWLVMEPGKQISLKETQDWCKKWLASYKKPEEIYYCNNLPRSGLGKLLRRELRDWYQEQTQIND